MLIPQKKIPINNSKRFILTPFEPLGAAVAASVVGKSTDPITKVWTLKFTVFNMKSQ